MKLNSTLYLIIVGLTAALAFQGGTIYIAYQSEENVFENFKIVEDANSLLKDLEGANNAVENLDKSYKNYELTQQPYFLIALINDGNFFASEIEKIKGKIKEGKINSTFSDGLEKMLLDQKSTAKLKVEKLKTFKDTIDYKSNLKTTYLQQIALGNKVTEIAKVQEKLLAQAKASLIEKLHGTYYSWGLVGLSSIILTLLVFAFIWQYNKLHLKIENDLLALNENKNKFFSIISHDLRGPVKNIVLMAQLLYQPANKTIEPEKLARLIESSANNLSSLLDNLLKWSRLQMNKIEFQAELIDLRKLADDVIHNLGVHAEQKSISITNFVVPDTYIYVDQNMIATVIRNLIYNALKFTNKGGKIDILSSKTQDNVQITVKDNGVGMPQPIAEKIFSIDFRHITKGTNKEEGTGLGLKLCKEFVEKNKGTIRVESSVNEGSEFIFTVPARAS